MSMSITLDQILSSQRRKINKPYPIFLSFIPKTQRTFLPIWHICPFSHHFFCQITQFSLSPLFSSALHASFLLLSPCSHRRICPRRKTPPISKTPKQENSTQYTPRLIPPSASYRSPVFFHWLLKPVLCAVVPDKPRGAPYRQKMLVSQSYTLNSSIGSHLSRVIAADKSIAQLTKTNTAQNHPRIHLLFVIPYSSSLKFSSKSYTAVDFHLSMGYNENRKVCTNVHFCSHFHSERIAP